MDEDRSNGWEAVAERFIHIRSETGLSTVMAWARSLPPRSAILDVGCGYGIPFAAGLVGAGHTVAGVDASPTLIAEFKLRFPGADAACESAETSAFFGRKFDAAIAIGLLFLLAEDGQLAVIASVGRALKPGGRFLFTAPWQICEWADILTGRVSRSLGERAYRGALAQVGLEVVATFTDEGENFYFDAMKRRA
jgi:SAM-dependent methyltransferase